MPASDDDAQRIAQLTPGTFVRHTRHPEWGVGVVSYKPVEWDQVPVIWPDQPNITAYQYPVWLERVRLGTVAAAPAGTGPNDDGWKVIAQVQDTTVFSGEPRTRPSETQAINELALALHTARAGCTTVCTPDDAAVDHWSHARTLFDLGWRPPWWFHNPDGTPNERPPVLYDPSTGRAL